MSQEWTSDLASELLNQFKAKTKKKGVQIDLQNTDIWKQNY